MSDKEKYAGILAAAGPVGKQVVLATVKSVFSTDPMVMIMRSSIFLLIFLLIHMLGNLNILGGAAQFNSYGHILHINPLLKAIESYLAAAFAAHAVAGGMLTWRKRKVLFKGGLTAMNRLALSSLVVLGFVVVHLIQFRFGAWYTYVLDHSISLEVYTLEAGTKMRDIYQLQLEVFTSPLTAHGYCAACGVLGAHLYWGWSKACFKMELAPVLVKPAERLGHAIIALVTLGFVACPLYTYWVLVPARG